LSELNRTPLLFTIMGFVLYFFIDEVEVFTGIPWLTVGIFAFVLTLVPLVWIIYDKITGKKK
jgi:hypothetical protein